MSKDINPRLSSMEKVEILHAFSLGNDEVLEAVSTFTGSILIEARTFISDVILDYFKKSETLKLTRGKMQKLWMPINTYYNAQGCLESMEACKMESCYSRNQGCFSRKLNGQIENMVAFFSEKIQQIDKKSK